MERKRTKGDSLILCILIVTLITIALLVGARQGFELGIKKCNNHYSEFIRNNCICFVNIDKYETERFIPISVLNIS